MAGVGAAFYSHLARVSADLIGSLGLESICVHRSVATGEVSFGRSDIDMLMVAPEDGAKLAALYERVRRVRMINPIMKDVDVFGPGGVAAYAEIDTCWASVERRAARLLRGAPLNIKAVPVNPEHALGRFLLWTETFFGASVQRRDARNIKKTALDCWNLAAVADGLLAEPFLLRSEMGTHLRKARRGIDCDRLRDPKYATAFVFGLARTMHEARLPALGRLARPLIFEATLAPLALWRRFVVVPDAYSPLPGEAFQVGTFLCTPELLHLFLRYKNSFLSWVLPQTLLDLGLTPPGPQGFLRDCRYFGHPRFLTIPGFANPDPTALAGRLECLRHAVDSARRGEAPPPIRPRMSVPWKSVSDYYRYGYGDLRQETEHLQASLP